MSAPSDNSDRGASSEWSATTLTPSFVRCASPSPAVVRDFVRHSNRTEGEPDEPGVAAFDDHLRVTLAIADGARMTPRAIHKRLMRGCDGRHAGTSRRVHRVPCGALVVTSERIDSVVVHDLCARCTAGREIRLRLEPLPVIALESCTPAYDARLGRISYGSASITNLRLATRLFAACEAGPDVHMCQLPDIYRVHEAAGVPPHEKQSVYEFAAVEDDGSITIYDGEDGYVASYGDPDNPHIVAVARALRARGVEA